MRKTKGKIIPLCFILFLLVFSFAFTGVVKNNSGNAFAAGNKVYEGSATIDYSDNTNSDFADKAYRQSNVQVVEMATYSSGVYNNNKNALAVAGTNAEGFVVYSFKAPDSARFYSLNVSLYARLCDFAGDVTSYIDIAFSTDDENYISAKSFDADDNVQLGYMKARRIDKYKFSDYVYGASEIYVKITVKSSNDVTWCNFQSVDFEFGYAEGHDTLSIDYRYQSDATYESLAYQSFNTRLVELPSVLEYPGKALAPVSSSAPATAVYKISAGEGKMFSSLKMGYICRPFDLYASPDARIEFYVGATNEDSAYSLVKKEAAVSGAGAQKKVTDIELSSHVYGLNEIYVKVMIYISTTDGTWTNLSTLTFDMEYATVKVTYHYNDVYGDEYSETLNVISGLPVGTVKNAPENFRVDDEFYYSDKNFTTKVEPTDVIDGNSEFYVKGVWHVYGISYELNGGENNPLNQTEYISAKGCEFRAPTKEGFLFSGWYSDSEFTKPTTGVEIGHKGEVKAYAKWVADTSIGITVDPIDGGKGCSGNLTNDMMIISAIMGGAALIFIGVRVLKRKEK